ncbi:hypothetical protein MVES_000716 [Malassezia vespertilionis]|uniref:Uncharacterized protein n=1 Tax=Malassezia vespertilionis TaxID=2020962 RepID=A0A2N1JGD6_9BASI|nr:hypothetical protein MVES_000716 [Malassezia vespertilionis]
MTIQDRFKARASRKYKAKHGLPLGKKEKEGEHNAKIEDDDGEEQDLSDNDADKPNDAHLFVARRPVTRAERNLAQKKEDAKYHRRKEATNTWRYDVPESDEEDKESEPEVDLSAIHHQVAALALQGKPQFASGADSDEEVEKTLTILPEPDFAAMRAEKEEDDAKRALKMRLDGSQTQPRRSAALWRRDAGAVPRTQHKRHMHEAPNESRVSIPEATSPTSALPDIDEFLASLNEPNEAYEREKKSHAHIPSPHKQEYSIQTYLDDLLG